MKMLNYLPFNKKQEQEPLLHLRALGLCQRPPNSPSSSISPSSSSSPGFPEQAGLAAPRPGLAHSRATILSAVIRLLGHSSAQTPRDSCHLQRKMPTPALVPQAPDSPHSPLQYTVTGVPDSKARMMQTPCDFGKVT